MDRAEKFEGQVCENCYGHHATQAEWDACWADEDAWDPDAEEPA